MAVAYKMVSWLESLPERVGREKESITAYRYYFPVRIQKPGVRIQTPGPYKRLIRMKIVVLF